MCEKPWCTCEEYSYVMERLAELEAEKAQLVALGDALAVAATPLSSTRAMAAALAAWEARRG